MSHALSALSVPFIENKGQADNNVAFYAKSIGSTLYVTKKGEMVYQLRDFTLVERITGYTAAPKGIAPSHTNVSSFGNDRSRWEKNLATYAAVSLGEITPGITVSLNAYGGKVEKIISVSPHTSPSIAFTIGGASSLGLGQAGELLVHTDRGNLTFSNPIAYQEINGKRVPVTVAYMLSHSPLTYTFALGPYDTSHALTIDPILQSTYLGGSNPDYANVIAVGASGIYVAGVTASTDFPGTSGGAQPAYGGDSDVFVALLSPDLKTLIQATYMGGSNSDFAYAIAIGAAGIYVAGPTLSTDFPGTTGGPQPVYAGGYCDAFVALLSPDLTDLIQATYLGGSNNDYAHALAVGPAGVYVAGYTGPDNFPGTAGGAQEDSGGAYDAFVALFSTDLKTLTQATYLGGFRDELAFALALGPAGVYVAGETFSYDFPGTVGGAQPAMEANNDVFVALLTTDLKTLTQATFLGAGGFDYAYALAVGQAGVYVSGYTLSTNFPGTAGGAQPTYGGGYTDTYVALLSPGLTTLTQSTYLGGSDDDRPRGLAIGTSGVYVSGYTLSTNFPGTTGGAQPSYGGGNSDSFVALLSPGLTTLTQSTYLGGGSSDEANAIAIGPAGVYVAGITGSLDFPATVGGAQPAGAGSGEAFVALLSPELGSGCYLTVAKSGDGTVTSDPPGINCGTDCSESYPQGTVVTLTAQADPGATLIGWSGACSGTNPQCVITMNANLTVEATFSLLPRRRWTRVRLAPRSPYPVPASASRKEKS